MRSLRTTVDALSPWVDQGYDIVILDPSCSLTLKDDLPRLLEDPRAKRIAERSYDVCEYLMRLQGLGKLRRDFKQGGGRVAYHLPSHLKVQNIGTKSADLLALIPDTEISVVAQSAATGRTWGRQQQNFARSEQRAQELYQAMRAVEADLYASDCSQARQRISHGISKPVAHPVEILRNAYGL
ncbi:MAG: hypothetical protein R3C68_19375 [Myxococcota bacterium]